MLTIDLHRKIVPNSIEEVSFIAIGLGHAAQGTLYNIIKSGGSKFFLYDYDTIEDGNLPSSLYTDNDVNHRKSRRMGRMLDSMSPVRKRKDFFIMTQDIKVTKETILPYGNFYLNMVDSGDGRAEVLNSIKNSIKTNDIHEKIFYPQWIIDIRIDFDYFELYFANLRNKTVMAWYEETVENIAGVVPETRCGERNYVGTVQLIGVAVLNTIVNILNGHYKDSILVRGSGISMKMDFSPPLPFNKLEKIGENDYKVNDIAVPEVEQRERSQ